MTKYIKTIAYACVLIAVTSAPAFAKTVNRSETIRTAQLQLAELGYFAGRYDGILGEVTSDALEHFQRTNGLLVTGALDAQTQSLLVRMNYGAHNLAASYDPRYMGDMGYYRTAYMSPTIDWGHRWHAIRTQSIPSRFAKIDISEERVGSLSNYSLTINGKPVLFAKQQLVLPQISKTFNLGGEDAIVITTSNGANSCSYRSFLLTIRSDNTFVGPKEIGNCADIAEIGVHNHAMFISFRDSLDNWAMNSVWRYENGTLFQL